VPPFAVVRRLFGWPRIVPFFTAGPAWSSLEASPPQRSAVLQMQSVFVLHLTCLSIAPYTLITKEYWRKNIFWNDCVMQRLFFLSFFSKQLIWGWWVASAPRTLSSNKQADWSFSCKTMHAQKNIYTLCSSGLLATNYQYFSLKTNYLSTTNQHYFLSKQISNRHQLDKKVDGRIRGKWFLAGFTISRYTGRYTAILGVTGPAR
jgi:hypothetical protein